MLRDHSKTFAEEERGGGGVIEKQIKTNRGRRGDVLACVYVRF